jgi:hypothetical protein
MLGAAAAAARLGLDDSEHFLTLKRVGHPRTITCGAPDPSYPPGEDRLAELS